MKLVSFFGSATIGLICLSCSGSSFILGGSQLPENPEKIVIRWNSEGGMLPEGESIYLSEDSCYWERWLNDCHLHLNFEMSEEEIKSIYALFREREFDKIDVLEEQEVYDRGGTSIDINLDNIYYRKSNSGMSFVMENDWNDYAAIENAIYETALDKIQHYKINANVHLSKNLINSGLKINLSVNNQHLFDSEKDTMTSVFNTTVYEGQNEFTMSLFDLDSLNSYGSPMCLTTIWFVKSLSDTSNQVVFDYEDGVLFGK